MLSETAVSGLLSFEALLDTQGRGARQRISGESGNPPEELCEEQELHETLKQGISSLREKEQLVLSLYYEKELSMKEIAQVLNPQPGNRASEAVHEAIHGSAVSGKAER